jgi:hypothetical protein
MKARFHLFVLLAGVIFVPWARPAAAQKASYCSILVRIQGHVYESYEDEGVTYANGLISGMAFDNDGYTVELGITGATARPGHLSIGGYARGENWFWSSIEVYSSATCEDYIYLVADGLAPNTPIPLQAIQALNFTVTSPPDWFGVAAEVSMSTTYYGGQPSNVAVYQDLHNQAGSFDQSTTSDVFVGYPGASITVVSGLTGRASVSHELASIEYEASRSGLTYLHALLPNVKLLSASGHNYEMPVTISGTVNLKGAVSAAQDLTFTFTPTGDYAVDYPEVFTRDTTLASDGSYLLNDVPPGHYRVGIKGSRWLQRAVTVDNSAQAVTGVDATLLPGDINNDNRVNILDLGLLADAFNTGPDTARWNQNADLNCDGKVNISDLGLLADNFGKSGDP